MQLSDAIRLGVFASPAGCALVGAAQADGIESGDYWAIMKHWPELQRSVACPACGETGRMSGIVMLHLNDGHDGEKWSKERIAAWVETIKPNKVEPEVVQAKEVEAETGEVVRA